MRIRDTLMLAAGAATLLVGAANIASAASVYDVRSVNVRYEDDIDEVVADATTWRDAGVDLCIVGLPLHVKPEQLAPLAEALAPLA